MTRSRRYWRRKVDRALHAATVRHDPTAQAWLRRDGAGFQRACQWAGLDPAWVRRIALAYMEPPTC